MAAISGKWRDALAKTANQGKKEVDQGESGKKQWQEPVRTDVMVNAIEVQTEKGDQKTEHGAAGVAHEDPGWRKVVCQKSEAGTEQTPGNRPAGAGGRRGVHRGVTESDQRCYSSGNAVGAVEKVERVDEDSDEKAGQDGVKNRVVEKSQIPLGLAEKKSRAQLRQQANLRAKIKQVVNEARIPNQPESEVKMDEVHRRAVCRNDQTEHDGQHHRHSAQARYGDAVNLQMSRLIVNLELHCSTPEQRQQGRARGKGQERGEVAVRCEEPDHS